VGLVDADQAPRESYYYETIFEEFDRNPRLGVASGFVYERPSGMWESRSANATDSVAGSAIFRRSCFDQVGGYVPLYYGGSDWLIQIDAKMAGWKIMTFRHDFPFRVSPSTVGDAIVIRYVNSRVLKLSKLNLITINKREEPVVRVTVGLDLSERVIIGRDGFEKRRPLGQSRNFSVFEREKIMPSIGDRVRFTKNVKRRGQQFLNNEPRTVVRIDEGRIIFDKGELVRSGIALHVDQGIAVTSHASQAKTVDQVIVNVPVRAFSRANEAQFYVSMSRARFAMLAESC
jgi:hypothetical protein